MSGTINDEGFKETEFRYAGKEPNNYVNFNDELWRIIGLVNVMTEENKVEQKVKIIRDGSLSKYAWDLNENKTFSNDWAQASLIKLLNDGTYYNWPQTDYYFCVCSLINCTMCDQVNTQNLNFIENGIKVSSKTMIEQVYWDIGIRWFTNLQKLIIEERTGKSIQNNIGLIYPSDYYNTTSTKDNCFLNTN